MYARSLQASVPVPVPVPKVLTTPGKVTNCSSPSTTKSKEIYTRSLQASHLVPVPVPEVLTTPVLGTLNRTSVIQGNKTARRKEKKIFIETEGLEIDHSLLPLRDQQEPQIDCKDYIVDPLSIREELEGLGSDPLNHGDEVKGLDNDRLVQNGELKGLDNDPLFGGEHVSADSLSCSEEFNVVKSEIM